MEKTNFSPREVGRLFAATDRLHRAVIEKGVNKSGVHRSQHFLLMKLHRLGGAASQKQLADELMISAAAVTVSLRKLQEGGYVSRVGSLSDSRRNEVRLTKKGEALMERSKAYFEWVDDRMCRDISEDEMRVFISVLYKMQKNLLEKEETPNDETLV